MATAFLDKTFEVRGQVFDELVVEFFAKEVRLDASVALQSP